MEKIARAIDALEIIGEFRDVTKADIEHILPPSPLESIFPVVDAIQAGADIEAVRLLTGLLRGENVYAALASLIANLRTTVYVHALSARGMDASGIANTLAAKPFPIKKALACRRRAREIFQIYRELCLLDQRVKTGRAL